MQIGLCKNSIICRTINARASCARGRKFVYRRPAKSYTTLQTRFPTTSTSTQVAVLPGAMTQRWLPPTR